MFCFLTILGIYTHKEQDGLPAICKYGWHITCVKMGISSLSQQSTTARSTLILAPKKKSYDECAMSTLKSPATVALEPTHEPNVRYKLVDSMVAFIGQERKAMLFHITACPGLCQLGAGLSAQKYSSANVAGNSRAPIWCSRL